MRHAQDAHREKKRNSENLTGEKARLEGKRSAIRSELKDLEKRISEAEKSRADVVEEQEKRQSGDELRELQKRRERSRSDLTEYDSRLTELDKKIGDAVNEVREAETNVNTARAALRETQDEVLASARAVIKEATQNTLWEKIRNSGARLFDKLGLSGTLTIGYVLAVITGLIGDFIYFGNNGVNIFHYAQPEDFFLSGYKLLFIPVAGILVLWLILAVIKSVPEKMADYGLPALTERMALYFPRLIDGLATPMAFVLLIYVTGPLTAYAVVHIQQWQQSAGDRVSIVLEDPFEYAGQLAWIGSNSRYAFFRPVTSQSHGETGVMIVPFDRIACIRDGKTDTGNHCRTPKQSTEVEFKQNEEIKALFERLMDTGQGNYRIPPVTESEVQSYVANAMDCDAGRPDMSDFILFENDKSDLRAQAYHKMDVFLEKDHHSSKPTVFGFASADGRRGENMELAGERACTVANVVCAVVNQDYGYFARQARTVGNCGCPEVRIIADKGEDHFINGVANSRSAVIAACG